jgi:hypothetical protein
MNVISVLVIFQQVKVIATRILLGVTSRNQQVSEFPHRVSRVLPGIFDCRSISYLKQHTRIPFFFPRPD